MGFVLFWVKHYKFDTLEEEDLLVTWVEIGVVLLVIIVAGKTLFPILS